MKAFWISALLLVTCASAISGISNSTVYGSAGTTHDRLAILRGTSEPSTLAPTVRRGFGADDSSQLKASANILPSRPPRLRQ